MRTDAQVLTELKRRRADGTLVVNVPFLRGDTTPIAEESCVAAETRLGFAIPQLLRAIYCDISNGGFGDAYGLLGLINGPTNEVGMDSVSLYEAYRQSDPSDEFWAWPAGLLPVCHLGCAMYHCVDCTSADFRIIWFEPNPHEDGQPWNDSFIPFCPSLNEYLSAWIDGVDLWAKLGEA